MKIQILGPQGFVRPVEMLVGSAVQSIHAIYVRVSPDVFLAIRTKAGEVEVRNYAQMSGLPEMLPFVGEIKLKF